MGLGGWRYDTVVSQELRGDLEIRRHGATVVGVRRIRAAERAGQRLAWLGSSRFSRWWTPVLLVPVPLASAVPRCLRAAHGIRPDDYSWLMQHGLIFLGLMAVTFLSFVLALVRVVARVRVVQAMALCFAWAAGVLLGAGAAEKVYRQRLRAEVRNTAVLVEALERFERDQGRAPRDFAEVVPLWLPVLPPITLPGARLSLSQPGARWGLCLRLEDGDYGARLIFQRRGPGPDGLVEHWSADGWSLMAVKR